MTSFQGVNFITRSSHAKEIHSKYAMSVLNAHVLICIAKENMFIRIMLLKANLF